MRWMIAVVSLGLLVSCTKAKKGSEDKKAPAKDMQVEKTVTAMAGAMAGAMPAAMRHPKKPPPPKTPALKSPYGTFLVPGLGDGWLCQKRKVARQRSELIKCKPKGLKRGYFLMAKAYDVSAGEPKVPLKEIFHKHFVKNYVKLFGPLKSQKEKAIEHQGVKGYEMLVNAKHSQQGWILHRDRAFRKGNRYYILTDSGQTMRFRKHEATADKWLAGFHILK